MEAEGNNDATSYALVLGASSGFGAATARALAKEGYNILGVHLDRSATLHLAEEVQEDIRAAGREAVFFNSNAIKPETRESVIDALQERGAKVGVVMHSLAFGALRPLVSDSEKSVTKAQLEMTLDVMANSLVFWVQDLVAEDLLEEGGHIVAMTSSGSLVTYSSYGPVSAAKAALESHARQLAVELASRCIAVNAVRAGVTDTPALRKIPGHEHMIEVARQRNPHSKLTTPGVVAEAITALIGMPYWVTGNVINVDGGEVISGG